MSTHPHLRLRLRVHQSPLRRARVNLHAFAPPSQGVLQIARAATMNEIARPRNVPTLWRRALVVTPSDHDRDVDDLSLASSSRESPLTIGAMSESPLAIDSMTESAMLFDALSPESPLALAVLTLDMNEGER